jgi:hypothetical protein
VSNVIRVELLPAIVVLAFQRDSTAHTAFAVVCGSHRARAGRSLHRAAAGREAAPGGAGSGRVPAGAVLLTGVKSLFAQKIFLIVSSARRVTISILNTIAYLFAQTQSAARGSSPRSRLLFAGAGELRPRRCATSAFAIASRLTPRGVPEARRRIALAPRGRAFHLHGARPRCPLEASRWLVAGDLVRHRPSAACGLLGIGNDKKATNVRRE